jgi:hypothetical protein
VLGHDGARAPRGLLLLAVLPLAIFGPGQAQAQPSLGPAITVTVLTPPPLEVQLQDERDLAVRVHVVVQNVVCDSPSSLDVGLFLQEHPADGIKGTLPATMTVPLPATTTGTAGLPLRATQTEGSGTVDLHITVNRTSQEFIGHAFMVTGSTPAKVPAGCQAVGPMAPAVARDSAAAVIMMGKVQSDIRPASSGTRCDADAPGPAGCPPARQSSTVPLVLGIGQVVILLGIAYWSRPPRGR